jgi:hypothetical protein
MSINFLRSLDKIQFGQRLGLIEIVEVRESSIFVSSNVRSDGFNNLLLRNSFDLSLLRNVQCVEFSIESSTSTWLENIHQSQPIDEVVAEKDLDDPSFDMGIQLNPFSQIFLMILMIRLSYVREDKFGRVTNTSISDFDWNGHLGRIFVWDERVVHRLSTELLSDVSLSNPRISADERDLRTL